MKTLNSQPYNFYTKDRFNAMEVAELEGCMYTLREMCDSESSKWEEIVQCTPGGTIFHTAKWLKMIGDNQKLRIKKIGIYQHNMLIGIFPLCIKKFFFIKIAGSPFVVEDTPYMGPVIDPSLFPNILTALDEYLRFFGIHFFRAISMLTLPLPKTCDRYSFFEKYTHILDLTEAEDGLWNSLEGRCRTAIRKARKANVVIDRITEREFIEKYYSMIEAVYFSQNMPCPNKKSFYYDMWDAFTPHHAIFLSATYHGEVIGGIIIIVDGKRAYYLNGASKHTFRSLSATNLLLWEAIKISKQKGVEIFDFVGSDIPRLAKFKKSFGGAITTHTLIEKASSNWVSLLRKRYPGYKMLLGKMLRRLRLGE